MKQSLPHNIENYNLIDEKNISERILSAEEVNSIRKFAKKYNSTPITHMVVWLIIGIFFLVLLIVNINNIGSDNNWILILFPVAFLFGAVLEFRKIISVKSAVKKSGTGVLNAVWSQGKGKSSNKVYYFDVLFPENNTRCRNAICLKEEHSSAEKGDKILVFAFRNNVYGCIL